MERGERLGPFRIIRRLGAGGMGEVYLATDLETCRHVALKTLGPEGAENPKMRRAFRKEAALGEALSHPNLASFFGAELDGPRPWLAFEYVVGSSLRDWLRKSGSLPPATAAGIVLDVALGLAAAHQKGVLHRDIKPDNVLVTPGGSVKLIDFGSALLEDVLEEGRGQGLITAPGVAQSFVGTWVYASPEQMQGKELDETSDLYSLALVFAELLTGSLVIEPGAPASIMLQHGRLEERLPRLFADRPEIPDDMAACIAGCLAFQAGRRRFSSAVDFAEALQAAVNRGGPGNEETQARRRLARKELAETDYWRARNLIDTGHVEEGLLRFQGLLNLPTSLVMPYRDQIRGELASLLRRLHDLWPEAEPRSRLRDLLSVIKQMVLLARRLDDEEILPLLERRFATLASRLDDPAEALRLASRFLSLVPRSIVVGSLCLTLARAAADPLSERDIRIPLAEICLESGSFRRALVLCLQAMKDPGSRHRGAELLGLCLERKKEHERDIEAFEQVLDALSLAGDPGPACNACRKRLRDVPEDRLTWERLGRLQLALGDRARAAESLRRAARLAFAVHDLSMARRLFAEVLRIDETDEVSLAHLVEMLHARNRLPRRLGSPRKIRLAVLCTEGLEGPARLALRRELTGTLGDLPWLRDLIPLARADGCHGLLEEIHLQIGRIHLDGGRFSEARTSFLDALAVAPDPSETLAELQALRDLRRVFSPLEFLRLRETTVAAASRGRRTGFADPRKRDTLAGADGGRAQPMARESLTK